jgi:multidrug efflux pump subunit AcrA (membrane-fusion protein)
MARIALGITLALLLATCFFGFETRSKVTDLAAQRDTAKSEAATAQQQAATAKANLRSAQDDLAKAKSATDAATAQVTTIQGNLDAANSQITVLSGSVTSLEGQLASATHTTIGNLPPPGPSAADLEKVNDQLKDAQAQIAELDQLKETLTNKEKDAESRADDLQKVVDHYKNSTLKNGLEGEVLAVNQGWNFVVLSIGDRQGAVANAEMILKRDGSQIGKVRITSVEPSTSVADIIPGSLARGVRVQPGDRVIFPGS